MEIDHVRYRNAVRLWLGAAALCCLPLTSFGQAQTFSEKMWWIQNRNTYYPNLDYSAGGTPSTATPGATGPKSYGYAIEPVANEWPKASGKSTFTLPSGDVGPVIDVKAKVKPAAAAAAIGRFAAKVAGPITVGIAVWDLAKELGFLPTRNSDGSLTIQKADPAVCTVSPCYVYSLSGYPTPTYSTPQIACTQTAIRLYGAGSYGVLGNNSTFCYMYASNGAYRNGLGINATSVAPSPASYLPSSLQELQDAIASKSGWPTSSAIGQTIADTRNAGEPIATEIPSVSGPASSPGPKSTTTKADGTTVTSTTTNNYTYQGNTVTYNTTTVVNTYNPTTNTTTTETTVSEPTEQAQEKDECTEYPNRVGCTDMDTPEGEIPKTTKALTYTAENLGFGAGACPANRMATLRNGQTITVFDYTKPCELIVTWVRPLILTLSAWIAFFILLPGGKTE